MEFQFLCNLNSVYISKIVLQQNLEYMRLYEVNDEKIF